MYKKDRSSHHVRGNPIDVPSTEQQHHPHRQNKVNKSPFIPTGFQVGRDTLDRSSSSSSTSNNDRRSSSGAKSLVLNQNRIQDKEKSTKPLSTSLGLHSLSHFSSGVPTMQKNRPLQMETENTAQSPTNRAATLTHQAQHRNASANTAKIVSASISPTSRKTRSAKKMQEEPIVLDDSEDDERHSSEQPSSSQSPQQQSLGTGKGKEQDKSTSRSSAESLTTIGDTEMDEVRSAVRGHENVESDGKPQSPVNGKGQHHVRTNSMGEQIVPLQQNASVSPKTHSMLHGKSFDIAQSSDIAKSGLAAKMKDKHGQTRSMIPPKSAPKPKAHDDKYYKSGFVASSNSSGRLDKPIKVKLRMIAFDPDGYIGSHINPTVEWSPFTDSIEIRWDEDGNGLEAQKIVIDFIDCESLMASKDSASMRQEPHRILRLKLLEDSPTAENVKRFLESVVGFGAVHGGNVIVLDAIHSDSAEEHNWNNFRRKLTKLRDRPLQDLDNSTATKIEASLKRLEHLTPRREERSPSTSSVKNIQATSRARPKPRPSVIASSNPFSSAGSQRTSDLRGVKRNEDDGYISNTRETTNRTDSRAKSPSPKKVLDPNKKLLNYPFNTSSSGYVTVLQADFDRLDPGEFLNDTMIDFGLKYLLEQIRQRDADLHQEIFVFSSFFYNRLNEKRSDRSVGYELVKKWTRKAELFKKKYIVVPINENLHWYLAIIVNPLFAIPEEIRNGEENEKEEVPGSEYNSARSSPRSGVEPVMEGDVSREIDLFAGDISAQHQHIPEIDRDGDSKMFPVLDKRTNAEIFQIDDNSDAISNRGGGNLTGGGEKRALLGNPFEPGQSFSKDEDEASKRSRRKISSQEVSNKIGTGAFYGKSTSTKSPEATPRQSPELRRSARFSGPPSPTMHFDLSNSRRSSVNLSQERSETWRKQLNEEATVCIFDSLQQKHTPVKTSMKHYLAYEYADKHNLKSAIDSKRIVLNSIDVAMPRQPNWADCGLYLLHAFERFFSDPKAFKDDVIPSKDEDHLAWKSEEALTLREYWRKTIEGLIAEYQPINEKREQEKLQMKAKKKEVEKNSLTTTGNDLNDGGKEEEADDVEIGGAESVEEVIRNPEPSFVAANPV